MERPKREDFDKICRLCLKSTNLVNIFERNPRTQTESLSTLVRETVEMLGLAIDPMDPYPRKICLGCKDFLRSLHKFRQRALEANDLVKEVADPEPDQEMPPANFIPAPVSVQVRRSTPEQQIPEGGLVLAVENETKNLSQNQSPVRAANHSRRRCYMCGAAFESSISLSTHIRNQHSGGIGCLVCNMKFMNKSNWNMHMLQQHNIDIRLRIS